MVRLQCRLVVQQHRCRGDDAQEVAPPLQDD